MVISCESLDGRRKGELMTLFGLKPAPAKFFEEYEFYEDEVLGVADNIRSEDLYEYDLYLIGNPYREEET